jgi:hypothetical protein
MKTTGVISALAFATALIASPAMAQADNTNSKTDPSFHSWMQNYSKTNKGRISRQAYMDEAGRRWDMMDKNNEGLTMSQINGIYGSQPNPTRVMKGNSATNPTGNEMKGQNSGGK